jgi:hypothetical protein
VALSGIPKHGIIKKVIRFYYLRLFVMRLFIFLFMCFSVVIGDGFFKEAYAQDAVSGGQKHLKITADRPAIIPLNDDASSVIIGNPAHAVATLDNPNTLIVNPLRPGVTSLVVLDEGGQVVFERQLLINPPKDSYVKINRVCSVSTRDTCRETSVFYCAGGCHEMVVQGQDVEGGMASDGDEPALDNDDADTSGEEENVPEEFQE